MSLFILIINEVTPNLCLEPIWHGHYNDMLLFMRDTIAWGYMTHVYHPLPPHPL